MDSRQALQPSSDGDLGANRLPAGLMPIYKLTEMQLPGGYCVPRLLI